MGKTAKQSRKEKEEKKGTKWQSLVNSQFMQIWPACVGHGGDLGGTEYYKEGFINIRY